MSEPRHATQKAATGPVDHTPDGPEGPSYHSGARADDAVDPSELYAQRERAFGAQRDTQATLFQRISTARLALFLVALGCAIVAAIEGAPGGLRAGSAFTLTFWTLAATAAIGFAACVVAHGGVERRLQWLTALVDINRHARARIARDWNALPPLKASTPSHDHPYAWDIDVFGHASLMQLVGASSSSMGRETLAAWLSAPADVEVVRARQDAVRELAPLIDFRQELGARGVLVGGIDTVEVQRFLAWAQSAPWLASHRALLWFARVSPVVLIIGMTLSALGVAASSFWLSLAFVNLLVVYSASRRAHTLFAHASALQAGGEHYASLMELVSDARVAARALKALQADLTAQGRRADWLMRQLQQLVGLADLRYSAMLHAPVQALTLWDVHVLDRLERWQQDAGPHVHRWLQALGEVEAITALAGARHDNPDWTFPVIGEREDRSIRAAALGHPLLPRASRVANDVVIGPPGAFMLITGSNMSGKSTLLRAVGLNVALAQAGGPVCAQRFALPPVTLWTSMRVQDSLEDGVSYFMAALLRLKVIVEASRSTAADGRRVFCYLLDEILQGTNSAERHVAVRSIVRHLIDQGAIGAITTHDLGLASDPALTPTCHPVYFRETVLTGPSGTTMSFDYRLREGVAVSRNALRLMAALGLEPDAGPAAE